MALDLRWKPPPGADPRQLNRWAQDLVTELRKGPPAGHPRNVKDYGALGTNAGDDTAAIQAAIDSLGATLGGAIFFPPGVYPVPGGLVVDRPVTFLGSGVNSTFIQAWHTDVRVIDFTADASFSGLRDLTVFGKGLNVDTGTFGATMPAVRIQAGAVHPHWSNAKVWGGVRCIENNAVDGVFIDVDCSEAYGDSQIYTAGSNWYLRCKSNQSATGTSITTALPYPARANTTGYIVGDAVASQGYILVCTVAGTSGGSPPTLLNYGRNITDGTVTWLLAAPQVYAAVESANGAGENHFIQCDFSGDFSLSAKVNSTTTPHDMVFEGCVFADPVSVLKGSRVTLNNCSLGDDVTVDTGYGGAFNLGNCRSLGAIDIAIGANVDDFSIGPNQLGASSTIVVAAGTSDRYTIFGNPSATVTDGGTGTTKMVLDGSAAGTWTPTLTFATPGDVNVVYSTRVGTYIKYGRLVFLEFNIITSTFTHTTAAGNMQITGNPLTNTGAGIRSSGAWQGITKAGYTDLLFAIGASATNIIAGMSGSGVAIANVTAADMPTGGSVRLIGTIMFYV